MSRTVTVRLADATRARLVDAAQAMALPVATLAARLIGDGLARPLVVPDDGPLTLAVREQFGDNNGHDAVRAALALLLARQIESGSTSGTERLLSLLRDRVESTAAQLEEDHRDLSAYLGMARHTYCESCRAEISDPEGARLVPGERPRTRREIGRLQTEGENHGDG